MRLQKHKLWETTQQLHGLVCYQDADHPFPSEEEFWGEIDYSDRDKLIEWLIDQGADVAISLNQDECKVSRQEANKISQVLKETRRWFTVYKDLMEN